MQMKADVGDVTMLINNAGLVNPAKILSVPDDRVQLLMDVNATAHLWVRTAWAGNNDVKHNTLAVS